MKQPTHYRKRNIIRSADGDTVCKSVNEAKRASRQLQMEADQALGRGTLRVVNKLPVLQEEKSSEHVGVADSANFYWTPEVSNG